MQSFRCHEWSPTAWQQLQLEKNKPQSLPWHAKLSEDESLPLKERCEHALQAFEQRRRASLARAIFCMLSFTFNICFIQIVVLADAWVLMLLSCLFAALYSFTVHAAVLGTHAAKQTALRIRRSLRTDSAELYLPSQTLLQGRYMLLLHSPWFSELPENDHIDGTSWPSWMLHRQWLDTFSRESNPKPCKIDLNLPVATDPDRNAAERAAAALVVFSARYRSNATAVLVMVLLTLIVGIIATSPYTGVPELGPYDTPVIKWLVVTCIVPCYAFYFFMFFKALTGAWVTYHIKSRIHKSIAENISSELPAAFDHNYYIPNEALLRQGFLITSTYPYYKELTGAGYADRKV